MLWPKKPSIAPTPPTEPTSMQLKADAKVTIVEAQHLSLKITGTFPFTFWRTADLYGKLKRDGKSDQEILDEWHDIACKDIFEYIKDGIHLGNTFYPPHRIHEIELVRAYIGKK